MTSRQPFHIFAAVGDAQADHLKQGSVRLGRTLRQAAAIKRYTQASIFVAQATEVEGRWRPASGAERHYPTLGPTDAEIQALNRARAAESSQASMTRHTQRRRASR